MTPKEKAQELIDAFYQHLPLEENVTTSDGVLSWEYDGWENAKQCALIAIHEQIKLYNEMNQLGLLKDNSIGFELLEVKQEIEKL
jgi:hypothetical protein